MNILVEIRRISENEYVHISTYPYLSRYKNADFPRAVCTKQYPKTLKTLEISRVKRQTYHKLMTIVSGKASDMYEADACILQAPAFYVVEKLQMQILMGSSRGLDYPENENRALHSSETLCFCMSIIGFACAGASCCIAQKSG